MPTRTRVLIVDDSPTARVALRLALEADPGVEVVGEAHDAAQALRLVRSESPDIVTMDVVLRHQSGLDVAAAIMEEAPCPILVVTAVNPSDPSLVYRAVEVGALDVCGKLPGYDHPQYRVERQRLVDLVKMLARVPVVRRRAGRAHDRWVDSARVSARETVRVVAIGASTGGPPVVNELLKAVPGDACAPIVVAQHMAAGFMRGFADWLTATCGHPVHLVERGEPMQPGHVYLAADDRHVVIVAPHVVSASDAPPRRHHRPSIDALLEDVAHHYGAGSLAIVLTGMGDDGAEGLLRVRQAGGLTIAQDPQTCVVDSMPARSIARGGAQVVLPPFGIRATLSRALAPSRAG